MPQQSPPEFSDQHLVTALQQGQTDVLGLLYDKYAPVLLGLATRIMRNQDAAEDVLQQTFVTAWERKQEYDNTRLRLLSWLILITRDTAMAALKQGNIINHAASAPFSEKATSGSENPNDETVDLKVKENFYNLVPNEKAALDLVYLQGYTCTEAAAELGIAEEILKARLKMAGKHLREGRF